MRRSLTTLLIALFSAMNLLAQPASPFSPAGEVAPPKAMPVAPKKPAGETPLTAARAALLLDARTGEEFFALNPETPRAIASTQKLLLALMVAELGNLDALATVTNSDTRVEGSKMGLKAGEAYPRRLLLQGLMVKSANDVANVLAREVAGGNDFGYPELANARAQALGCTDTRIKNSHGLTVQGQYSTARDLARIARAAYAQPELLPMLSVVEMEFPLASGEKVKLTNTNKLLKRMPACNGMKTGYTNAAGHCLVASASAGGTDLIAVILGSTEEKVIDEAKALLESGFARKGIDPTPLKAVPVGKAAE
jgi:D-alanyl-D-alanine carboxypeptidase (penicillin-binding protein 5/6)